MVFGALRRSKGPGCSRGNVVEAASRSRQSEKAEDRQNDETRPSRRGSEQFAWGVKSVRSHFRRKEVTYENQLQVRKRNLNAATLLSALLSVVIAAEADAKSYGFIGEWFLN